MPSKNNEFRQASDQELRRHGLHFSWNENMGIIILMV